MRAWLHGRTMSHHFCKPRCIVCFESQFTFEGVTFQKSCATLPHKPRSQSAHVWSTMFQATSPGSINDMFELATSLEMGIYGIPLFSPSAMFLPRGLVIFPCSLSLVIHLMVPIEWTRLIKWIKCMQQCNPTPSATKKTMAKQTLQDCRGMCWLSKNRKRFPNNAHFTGDPWRKIKNRDLE